MFEMIIQFNIYNPQQIGMKKVDFQNLKNQKDQFLALSHIYLDEFQVVKQSAPYKFNILCKPYRGNQQEYQINLMFEYPHNYPNVPLKYEIEPVAGITRDNINQINKKIDQILSSNMHQPIVFDIVEETRNWIHEYLVDGKAIETEETQIEKKIEVFERPKFAAFTPVTVQSFNAWKKQFDAKNKVVKKQVKENEVKISGKQWFMGVHEEIVQSEEDQEDEEDEQQEQIVERVQPENALFENE